MLRRALPLLVAAGLAAPLTAQPRADAGDGFRNLQVLPADISRHDLERTMSRFTAALGVRCSHCHVGRGRERDFAADDKPAKETARAMLRLTAQANDAVQRAVGPTAPQVECFTCHHGTMVPQTLQAVLRETLEARGIDAAVDRYEELRAAYYGRATYDFGESALLDLAGDLADEGRDTAAIEVLRLNLANFPESSFTLVQLGTLLHRTGARREARMRLQEALRLDPDNRWARRRLQELFGPEAGTPAAN